MAMWSEKTARTRRELFDYLNGVIFGSENAHGGLEVDGLTLIIQTDGSNDRTVTFAPAKSQAWTTAEMLAEIRGTHADLADAAFFQVDPRVPGRDPVSRLKLIGALGNNVIVRSTGTANTLFGLDDSADTTGTHIPNTGVARLIRNIQGQDNWTAIIYV